jgi:hypothetical protein
MEYYELYGEYEDYDPYDDTSYLGFQVFIRKIKVGDIYKYKMYVYSNADEIQQVKYKNFIDRVVDKVASFDLSDRRPTELYVANTAFENHICVTSHMILIRSCTFDKLNYPVIPTKVNLKRIRRILDDYDPDPVFYPNFNFNARRIDDALSYKGEDIDESLHGDATETTIDRKVESVNEKIKIKDEEPITLNEFSKHDIIHTEKRV